MAVSELNSLKALEKCRAAGALKPFQKKRIFEPPKRKQANANRLKT